jgi:hypothetical protein
LDFCPQKQAVLPNCNAQIIFNENKKKYIMYFFYLGSIKCVFQVNSLGLENMSQAMGFMMVFRASSIVGPPVAGLLYEATRRSNFSLKLTDSHESDLSPESC